MTREKARVLLVYTGGTIGMSPVDPLNLASPLVPQPLGKLQPYVPGLKKTDEGFYLEAGMGIQVDFETFKKPVDSADIGPAEWLRIAHFVRDRYDEFDGFVVLHGTDTMAFTTSALAFMFQNLGKPVVVTGSQLPISLPRTDARQNLISAIHVAGYKALGLPRIPEVVLVFAGKILRGCRATKYASSGFDSFRSPNCRELGEIGEHVEIFEEALRPSPDPADKLIVTEEIGSKEMHGVDVDIVSLHPAFRPSRLRDILEPDSVRGLVLLTFGTGNAPSNAELLQILREKINPKKGRSRVVVNVTQCLEGSVEMGLYEASSGLLEEGVISGLDLTLEAAFAKLYWTLATQFGSEITAQMQISQRGEQSLNLFDLRYGSSEDLENSGSAMSAKVSPDRRFTRSEMSRAVVRLSGVEFDGVEAGTNCEVKVFMNKPLAGRETPAEDPHCVAHISTAWEGRPTTLLKDVTDRAGAVIGEGAIVLTVVSSVPIRFGGLFLALFART